MKILAIAALCLLAASPLHAQGPTASEASIKELIAVMQAQKRLDGMSAQMDLMMQGAMKQAQGGRTLTRDQQDVLDDMRRKMVALVKEEMVWEKFEPDFIEIYRKTFTEQEVRGM